MTEGRAQVLLKISGGLWRIDIAAYVDVTNPVTCGREETISLAQVCYELRASVFFRRVLRTPLNLINCDGVAGTLISFESNGHNRPRAGVDERRLLGLSAILDRLRLVSSAMRQAPEAKVRVLLPYLRGNVCPLDPQRITQMAKPKLGREGADVEHYLG